jgi:glycosyltransferase involved in cell wall biosynthesis
MRVAIVQDFLTQWGGAERCLEILCEIFPEAPIYTLVHRPEIFVDREVRTSFAQRLPFARRFHYLYLPLYATATRSLDLSGFDVVISSSAAFTKNVHPAPGAVHICLCYTPMRFAHAARDLYTSRLPRLVRPPVRFLLAQLRDWDLAGTSRVDELVAVSEFVRERIRETYRRDATVIHPPVDTEFFTPGSDTGDYYLIVCRLVPQKRLDLAVAAFRDEPERLKIVGVGPDSARLRRLSGANVELIGRVEDDGLRELYRGCKAFIHTAEEEFGIAPLEAQACGKPVLALAAGGLLETIEEGRTGHFFASPSVESLRRGIAEMGQMHFDPKIARANALRFSRDRFRDRFRDFVTAAIERNRREPMLAQPAGGNKPAGAGS